LSFFNELKRRNVIRVGVAYIVTAWVIIQVVETLFPVFEIGNESIRLVVILLAVGLLPVLFFAWAFELTSEGVKREKNVDRS
jgi:adenylate cyclase